MFRHQQSGHHVEQLRLRSQYTGPSRISRNVQMCCSPSPMQTRGTTSPQQECALWCRCGSEGRSSVSITDPPLTKKCPMEMHGRSQENGLFFERLSRNLILTWSQLILKTPIAIAVTPRWDFVCATGGGTIRREPNFNTLQVVIVPRGRRRLRERRIKLGQLQREECLWVTT